jgi:CHAT domain-containing protein
VLSACETGLGPVTSGEGVFGLQRAFFLAGSQSIVMALWRVHDSSTALLMENFYTHLHSGASRSAALRSAQIAIRRRFPMPLHWGGFICQGDPRRLKLQRTLLSQSS